MTPFTRIPVPSLLASIALGLAAANDACAADIVTSLGGFVKFQ
jgi:hypothetical protein